MDTSKELVATFYTEGVSAFRKAMENVRSEFLSGEGRIAFDFCVDYHQLYGALPTPELITLKKGITLPVDSKLSGSSFYLNDLKEHRLQTLVKGAVNDAATHLAAWKPKDAFELLEIKIREIRADQVVGSAAVPLYKLAQPVWDRYEQIKNGAHGVLTPWGHINDSTLGFWPQDLVLFIARVGIGKSWTAAMMALVAWEAGHKVLFATTEMEQDRIAQRIFALKAKINYTNLTSGKLGEFAEPKFHEMLFSLKQTGFHVVGGDFDFEIGNFEAAIDQVEPDIVFLDGAYLLKVPGHNRTEQAANAFNELKRLNSRIKVPIITTMQFNREVKANQATSVRTESIALTDVASWNASLIYGLIQTEDMKKQKKLIFKNLKSREGVGVDFECNWNLETMDFTQLGKIDKIVDENMPEDEESKWQKKGKGGGGKSDVKPFTPGDASEDGNIF